MWSHPREHPIQTRRHEKTVFSLEGAEAVGWLLTWLLVTACLWKEDLGHLPPWAGMGFLSSFLIPFPKRFLLGPLTLKMLTDS